MKNTHIYFVNKADNVAGISHLILIWPTILNYVHTYQYWIVRHGHAQQSERMQKVDTISDIGECLGFLLFLGIADIPEMVLAVGTHKNG